VADSRCGGIRGATEICVDNGGGVSGACYGDSGGPTFLGAGAREGDVVVAVTSTGDNPCYSTNVSARTDSSSARVFLSAYGL